MKPKPRTLRKEVFLPHPPEDVWLALTDPQALAEWLMPNNFEPVAGRKFRFHVDPMPGPYPGGSECEVLEVDAPRRLVYNVGVCKEGPDQTASAADNGHVDTHARTRRHAPRAGTLGVGTRDLLAAVLHEHRLGTHDQETPSQGASQCEGRPVHTGSCP